MRGSVDYQINRLFLESGIFAPGSSRHVAKQKIGHQLFLQGKQASSTALGEGTGLYSYSYAEDCKDTWHALGHLAREEYRLRNMLDLRGVHVEAYLLRRIEDEIGYRTWIKEVSHLGKLDNALRMYFSQKNIAPPDFGIYAVTRDGELRDYAKQRLVTSQKDYGEFKNPEGVMEFLCRSGNEAFELAASIQWKGGARRREACLIQQSQLQGIKTGLYDENPSGRILLTDTKGGRCREISIPSEIYTRIERIITRYGIFTISPNSYARAVRDAARHNKEINLGTHAWRYCFARTRYKLLTRSPILHMSHEEALQQVSWEMGHSRANITCWYLR